MSTTFAVVLGYFIAHTPGARTAIFSSSALPESKVLILLGGGLMVLAGLMRILGLSGKAGREEPACDSLEAPEVDRGRSLLRG